MPKIDLIASRDFTYNTRRLKAGEPFQARNADDAMFLTRLLKKATYGRPVGKVAPPPPEVVEQARAATQPPPPAVFVPTIKEVLAAKVIAPKAKKPAAKRATKRRDKAKK